MTMMESREIKRLRGFLLDTLSEDERQTVEQALLADDALFELLLSTEEGLMDQYVRGTLSRSEAAGLRRYLEALPDGRRQLAFSKSLQSYVASRKAGETVEPNRARRPRRLPRLFAAVAAVVLVGLGALLALATIYGLRGEIEELHSRLDEATGQLAEARARNEQLSEAVRGVEEPRTGPADPRTSDTAASGPPSILLSAGMLRGSGGMPTLSFTEDESLLEIRLDIGIDEYEAYRAALHDAEGREVMAASQLEAQAREERIWVSFPVPTGLLASGDYYITLAGLLESGGSEPVARYDFRVARN